MLCPAVQESRLRGVFQGQITPFSRCGLHGSQNTYHSASATLSRFSGCHHPHITESIHLDLRFYSLLRIVRFYIITYSTLLQSTTFSSVLLIVRTAPVFKLHQRAKHVSMRSKIHQMRQGMNSNNCTIEKWLVMGWVVRIFYQECDLESTGKKFSTHYVIV